jgi:hypothetical protein
MGRKPEDFPIYEEYLANEAYLIDQQIWRRAHPNYQKNWRKKNPEYRPPCDKEKNEHLKVHGIQMQDSLGFVKIFIDAQTLKDAKLRAKEKNIDLEHKIRMLVQQILEGI